MAGYGTDDGFTAWAAAAGHTVPAGTIAAARQRGSVFVDGTYGARFVGSPTGGYAQDRAWPRTGALTVPYGETIPSDVIPAAVINASYEAALVELTTPGSLSPVIVGSQRVVREKVEGAVEVEYARPSGASDLIAESTPVVSVIAGMLALFLTNAKGTPWALVV